MGIEELVGGALISDAAGAVAGDAILGGLAGDALGSVAGDAILGGLAGDALGSVAGDAILGGLAGDALGSVAGDAILGGLAGDAVTGLAGNAFGGAALDTLGSAALDYAGSGATEDFLGGLASSGLEGAPGMFPVGTEVLESYPGALAEAQQAWKSPLDILKEAGGKIVDTVNDAMDSPLGRTVKNVGNVATAANSVANLATLPERLDQQKQLMDAQLQAYRRSGTQASQGGSGYIPGLSGSIRMSS